MEDRTKRLIETHADFLWVVNTRQHTSKMSWMCVANHVIFLQNMFSHVVTLFSSSFSWFSHFWCPVCHPNVLFCNYKKVFAFWMLQLFYPPTGALWKCHNQTTGPYISVPVYVTGSLHRPRLSSGLLDFVFYLIPTFLLRSDRPMKKPVLEVGFQSSFIKIDWNWWKLMLSRNI